MNDEAVRERLAAAIRRSGLGLGYTDAELPNMADVLLPVVREIAAEELRRAYIEDRTTVAKLSPVERLTCFVVKMEDLVLRAEALQHPGVPFDGVPSLGGDESASSG